MTSRFRTPLTLALLLALGACAGGALQDMPSLARRPVETPRPDPTPKPVTPADAPLAERIAAVVKDAKAGDAAFNASAADAQPRVNRAANAAAGSEAWIDAQQAVAGVEVSRGQTVSAQVAIDALLGEQLNAMAGGEATGGATEIAAAQAEITAIVESQAARLDALQRSLRR